MSGVRWWVFCVMLLAAVGFACGDVPSDGNDGDEIDVGGNPGIDDDKTGDDGKDDGKDDGYDPTGKDPYGKDPYAKEPGPFDPINGDPLKKYGCSPGFWKNSAQDTGVWTDEDSYGPSDTVGSVFHAECLEGDLRMWTLDEALNSQGGDSLYGAREILLRAAVAALLNTAHPGVYYPYSDVYELIADVNEALCSADRATILYKAWVLDRFNNLGCTIDEYVETYE